MKIVVLLIIVTISAYTDGKENKIRNKYIVPALIVGLIISVITGGVSSLKSSIVGMIIPITILFPFFLIRVIGAGDIKLFAVIGAIMGKDFIINNFFYSLAVAGIMAIVALVVGRNILKRLKTLVYYIGLCIISMKLLEYPEVNEKNAKLPLAISIFVGTVLQLIINYKVI